MILQGDDCMGRKRKSIDDYKFVISYDKTMTQEAIDEEFKSLINFFNDLIIKASRDPKTKHIFDDCDLSWLNIKSK